MIHTETSKGACGGAASFSDEERKVGVGLLDRPVVGLEELPVCVQRSMSASWDGLVGGRLELMHGRSRFTATDSANSPCSSGCLTGLAEVESDLLESLGQRFCQCVGRHVVRAYVLTIGG